MAYDEAVLLKRYADDRDAEAFHTLLDRHQGMVFAACHRVLSNPADAEDAAQDTFLQLTRHAGRLRAPIGGWLHRVAVNTSFQLARRNGARRKREVLVARQTSHNPGLSWDDVKGEVDQAIAALPKRLQAPIVLHYLEGRKQKDVAEELGLTQGAVSKRLRRGEEALRKRLRDAGLVVPCAVLVSMLTANAIEAVPATLAAALGKMALSGISAGKTFTVGGLSAMKLALIVVAATAAVTVGIVQLGQGQDVVPAQPAAAPAEAEQPAHAPAPAPVLPEQVLAMVEVTSPQALDEHALAFAGAVSPQVPPGDPSAPLLRLLMKQDGSDPARPVRILWLKAGQGAGASVVVCGLLAPPGERLPRRRRPHARARGHNHGQTPLRRRRGGRRARQGLLAP